MATTREQVAELIGRDLSVRQISQLLNISTQAVYKHLQGLGIDPPGRRGDDGSAAA